jgi:hypothetical protein
MGLAQGRALRAKVKGVCHDLLHLEAFRLRQPRWLPYALFRRVAGWKARRQLGPAVAATCPEAAKRLKAIAEGATVGEDDLWLIHAMEAVLGSALECTTMPTLGACAAFAVRGRRSAIREPVIAHNFDYLSLVQPYFIIRDSRPKGGFRSLDFTVAALCGTIDGVNEKGLAVSYNYAQTLDESQPAPTITMVVAEVLARCRSVLEAIDHVRTRPRWGSGILMLVDGTGEIASLELSNTRSAVRRPGPGEEVLFHTNAYHCGATREIEVSEAARYNDRAPRALRGQMVLDSSRRRDERFAELLRGGTVLGLDDIAALMADHGAGSKPSDKTICQHSAYWVTSACIQLLPHSGKLRFSFTTACEARYDEISL